MQHHLLVRLQGEGIANERRSGIRHVGLVQILHAIDLPGGRVVGCGPDVRVKGRKSVGEDVLEITLVIFDVQGAPSRPRKVAEPFVQQFGGQGSLVPAAAEDEILVGFGALRFREPRVRAQGHVRRLGAHRPADGAN